MEVVNSTNFNTDRPANHNGDFYMSEFQDTYVVRIKPSRSEHKLQKPERFVDLSTSRHQKPNRPDPDISVDTQTEITTCAECDPRTISDIHTRHENLNIC